MTILTAVIGATGYVGGELLRLISAHPEFHLAGAISESKAATSIANVFPHLASAYGDQQFVAMDGWADGIDAGSKLALFAAAPHGASAAAVAKALELATKRGLDVHVVDSSADFRFADAKKFESVYGTPHAAPELIAQFSCGVPEHITGTLPQHIGHPGCFATAMLLAAVPLYDAGLIGDDVFVCGTTGSTGSGKSPQAGTHHPERHSNFYAYKPLVHRHVAEVESLITAACGSDASVSFVAQSGPFSRGIYVTLQARLNTGTTSAEVLDAYTGSYEQTPFVKIVDGAPRLKNIVASNYAHLGIAVEDGRVAITCAIDNLVKGAAGGAMQWMNRLNGLEETSGLLATAPGWT